MNIYEIEVKEEWTQSRTWVVQVEAASQDDAEDEALGRLEAARDPQQVEGFVEMEESERRDHYFEVAASMEIGKAKEGGA